MKLFNRGQNQTEIKYCWKYVKPLQQALLWLGKMNVSFLLVYALEQSRSSLSSGFYSINSTAR
jgi:hypothetical protein